MEPQDENLDLLDLGEENEEVDALPEATPFSSPRPKRPWLLMGLGFAVIFLSTWIIVSRIGNNSGSTVSVDLDTPVVTAEVKEAKVADLKVPEKVEEKKTEKVAEKPAEPVKEVAPVETDGTPIRVVEDRKEVTFNPDKAPVAAKTTTVAKPVAQKKTATTTVKKTPVATASGNIYVQFGSYSTKALAQAAEKRIRSSHASLFSGKQFVILAAEVKGQTIYRLRVPFHSANDANGFCRNAKSDGLDCYVTK